MQATTQRQPPNLLDRFSRQETESPTKIVGIIVSYQRNHHNNNQPKRPETIATGIKINSSTFSTLLSSQGSSAPKLSLTTSLWGNLTKLTGVASACQTGRT